MAGKTRAPHKEGCQCVVCKAVRGATLAEVVVRVQPPVILASSLKSGERFEFKGGIYRVGSRDGDVVMVLKEGEITQRPQPFSLSEIVKRI